MLDLTLFIGLASKLSFREVNMLHTQSRRHCMRNMLNWGVFCAGACYGLPSMAKQVINVGVTAQRDSEQTRRAWAGVGNYLASQLSLEVNIVPIPISRVYSTAVDKRVDAILCNPNQALLLTHTRKAQLLCSLSGQYGPRFGGVILVNKQSRIADVSELRTKAVAALGRQSAGGFLFQASHLKKRGLLARRDYGVVFAETQDEALWSLRKGEVAAAFIRSGMIEQLRNESYMDLNHFVVLDQRQDPTFPLLHTTELFPEHYLLTLTGFPDGLASDMKQALRAIPKDSKILTGTGITAFIEPLSMEPLEMAMRELRMAPFDGNG